MRAPNTMATRNISCAYRQSMRPNATAMMVTTNSKEAAAFTPEIFNPVKIA